MDCKTAHYLLNYHRPHGNDLDADDQAALESHLAVCTDCDGLARSERQFDDHLGCAVRDVPIPHGLKSRLLDRLRRQRDDWWQQRLGRAMRYSAVAAAALLLVWAGFLWHEKQLPALRQDQVVSEVQGHYRGANPRIDEVEEWFAGRGHEVSVPPRFDYSNLRGYGMAPLNNREVPHLLFVRFDRKEEVAQVAEVFILSKDRFKLEDIRSEIQIYPPANITVNLTDRGDAYVIVHTGALDDLLLRQDHTVD